MTVVPHAPQADALPPCDITKRYVRILKQEDDFVLFEFSIAWEELVVELMLPPSAFIAFCNANHIIMLPPHADEDSEQTSAH